MIQPLLWDYIVEQFFCPWFSAFTHLTSIYPIISPHQFIFHGSQTSSKKNPFPSPYLGGCRETIYLEPFTMVLQSHFTGGSRGMGWTSPHFHHWPRQWSHHISRAAKGAGWSLCSVHLEPRGRPSLLRQWPPSDLEWNDFSKNQRGFRAT